MNPYYELVFDYKEKLSDCELQNISSNVVIFRRSLLCDTSSLPKLMYFLFTIDCYDFFLKLEELKIGFKWILSKSVQIVKAKDKYSLQCKVKMAANNWIEIQKRTSKQWSRIYIPSNLVVIGEWNIDSKLLNKNICK